MIRRPPRSTRTDTLFPYTTLFRSSGLLTCHRPIASRMLDVDEECCQIGRIGKTCDLAAHRTDQKALRLLGRLIDIEHGIVTNGLVHCRAGHAGIAGTTRSEASRLGKECVS